MLKRSEQRKDRVPKQVNYNPANTIRSEPYQSIQRNNKNLHIYVEHRLSCYASFKTNSCGHSSLHKS